ncbi:alpha/beta hydrolase [Dyella sp. GSA-30]|uniref:alpha/beta hydrolase n=1 Tax=Dyella sp. GSA-30 TaxID=2994496 RepID=UPI0024922AC8|nr:alpha/beta hydrolase [Dyella sp. GSA-30]
MAFVGKLLVLPAHKEMGSPPADLSATAVSFASTSGNTIRGWFIPGLPRHGAVLLLHGVHANRLAMLPRARWLHDLGYSVLLIDFQAAGESEGNAVTFGYRESRDAGAALDWLRLKVPGERIGIIATSMGGAAVLLAEPTLQVDAIVLEQVYPTIQDALRDRLSLHVGPAGPWLTQSFLITMHAMLAIDPERLRPIDHIGGMTAPILLIAGDADRHTRLDESRAMYAAAGAGSWLWIVPGARHVDLYRYASDAYRQRVRDFLEATLQKARFASPLAPPHPNPLPRHSQGRGS